jgi:hypothetical protein
MLVHQLLHPNANGNGCTCINIHHHITHRLLNPLYSLLISVPVPPLYPARCPLLLHLINLVLVLVHLLVLVHIRYIYDINIKTNTDMTNTKLAISDHYPPLVNLCHLSMHSLTVHRENIHVGLAWLLVCLNL